MLVSESIFARIINCSMSKLACNKLKEEFEENDKVKAVKILTLKKEFELSRMIKNEDIKSYFTKIIKIVNQI